MVKRSFMRNAYFHFKQFTIYQEKSGMKVCTDSCILGAWSATRLNGVQRVLDIGTGTGLLTLMLAQKNQARFDAIELDADSFEEADENIKVSPWADKIRFIQGDVREFDFKTPYDFIITNPPFFESDLHSPSPEKNLAKHSHSLSLEELINKIHRILSPSGSFSILLPFHRTNYFEKLAADSGFFLQEKLLIRQTPSHAPFRSVLSFSLKERDPLPMKELLIRDEEGNESAELLDLLRDYYLR